MAASASRSNSRAAPATTRSSAAGSAPATRTSSPRASATISIAAARPSIATVRRYAESSTCSTPGMARAPRNASSGAGSNGARAGRRSASAPFGAACGARRISPGGRRNVRPNAARSRRALAKPDAAATSASGRRVSSSSRRAKCTRRVSATSSGEAPTCSANSPRNQRDVTPSRAASVSTDPSSSAPPSISRSARRTSADVPCQAAEPGAVSGLQRRHGRNPAASAAAALAKNEQWRRAGSRAGQTGRQ